MVELHVPECSLLIPLQQALTDLGAVDNFIKLDVAQTLQIPLKPKPVSDLLEMIDGSPLFFGPMATETIPLWVTSQ